MMGPGTQPDTVDWVSLAQIVDGLPHAAAVLGATGCVEHENLAFRSLRSQAIPAIEPNGFLATLTHDERDALARLVLEDGTPREAELQLDWRLPGASTAAYSAKITRLTLNEYASGYLLQILGDQSLHDPRLRFLMENLVQRVWDYDLRTSVFTASKAWHQLRGLPPDRAIDMANDDWLELVHPDDRDALISALHDQEEGDRQNLVIQYRHVHSDGHWVWILCRASVVESDSDGRPLRIIGTDTDISEAMQNQEAINRLASKLTLAVEASGMGIWEYNPETDQVHWDDRLLEIYGVTDGQNVRSGDMWETYLHPDDYEDTVAYAAECDLYHRDFNRDFRIVRPGGTVRHVRSLARKVNETGMLIGVNIDVTDDYQRAQELEAARAKLEHDALHDELTGLGNRRALDQAANALFNRIPDEGRYAVMQIDLDHFKTVNDTLGHSAGDFVLRQVAQSLRDIVEPLGRAYRVGGDEFSILFEDAPAKGALNALSEKLIEALSTPMSFEGQSCAVGASVGYAIGKGPPESHSSIFIDADTALYSAKRAGRFTYRAYTDAIGKEFHVVANARNDLQEALNEDEIVCFLQPQYDVDTLEIVGAEALVRWQSPTRGLLTPDQFLPSAMDAGLMEAIDRCVFQRVTNLQTAWRNEGLVYPRISVNVSRARFEDEGFLVQTREALGDHHRIAFELLETTFYDTPSSDTLLKLDALRDLGIRIEMDDFGTGYASVKALQALKPDAVKIDRSLVAPIEGRATQLDILQNLSRIARLEGADVVVEGLETGAQMAAIRKLDCDLLQGYVLQRPMPETDFAALLSGAGSFSMNRPMAIVTSPRPPDVLGR